MEKKEGLGFTQKTDIRVADAKREGDSRRN